MTRKLIVRTQFMIFKKNVFLHLSKCSIEKIIIKHLELYLRRNFNELVEKIY
jgi:hypothetical protein